EYLGQEVDNIIRACNQIGRVVAEGHDKQITVALLCDYNADVLRDLKVSEGVVPGQLRRHNVGVGMYRGLDHNYVPELMERFCQWLNRFDFNMPELPPEAGGILKAVLAHLYIAWIHPLGDGNGRTARLIEFDILLRSGVPSPAAHLLSNHYNATRSEYYRQLDAASCQKTPIGFVEYAIQGFLDGLREQLELVTEQTRDIVWRNYVHERFREMNSEAARRQRHVVLDLSGQAEPIAKAEIPSLTPRLRKAYAGKTDKTLSRDLSKLLKMEILTTSRGQYSPNLGLIEAFLPMRRSKEQAETGSGNRK
ncbi:MAG: Fic family protein, partial [Phycisphaerae bacterium]|nr:Fic family protein [Phycisphaerae bacterium]